MFLFVTIAFSAAATMALFAIYQYRRGAAFTIKYGWRCRAEYPASFWWAIVLSIFMAAMFATPGLVALLGR